MNIKDSRYVDDSPFSNLGLDHIDWRVQVDDQVRLQQGRYRLSPNLKEKKCVMQKLMQSFFIADRDDI